jgi:hypothetical protein
MTVLHMEWQDRFPIGYLISDIRHVSKLFDRRFCYCIVAGEAELDRLTREIEATAHN